MLDDAEMKEWGDVVQMLGVDTPVIGQEISDYLQELDVPVTGIIFKNESSEQLAVVDDNELTEKQRIIIDSIRRPKKTTLTHVTELGSADFDLSEESKGTRNLIGFFMPWAMSGQHVVMVDEFDSSLHPEIVVALVRKFLKADGQGQLIFTTHDTHLMDSKLLRRDQFWLTERNNCGATRLRSVYDFAGRETEDVEKRYFEGHYRALPVIRKPDQGPVSDYDGVRFKKS